MVPQENRPEKQDAIAAALRDFYLRSHRVLDRIMTERGASYARAKLLMFIVPQGFCRSTDIAAHFGYAPRTVTEAIDGLERDGLVRREPDPDDRRAKRISLTDLGRTIADAAEQSRRDYVETVFSALDEAERVEIVRLVAKLNHRLAELGG